MQDASPRLEELVLESMEEGGSSLGHLPEVEGKHIERDPLHRTRCVARQSAFHAQLRVDRTSCRWKGFDPQTQDSRIRLVLVTNAVAQGSAGQTSVAVLDVHRFR